MKHIIGTILYYPSWNYIDVRYSNLGYFHLWVYFSILFGALFLIVLRLFYSSHTKEFSKRTLIRNSSLCVFVLIIAVQVYSQNDYLGSLRKSFSGQNIEQKYLRIFGQNYAYTRFVLNHVSGGKYSGRLITDLDPSQTLEPYILKYFLYPRVNLLDQTDSPSYLIIFRKSEPERFVPDDFEIIGRFNSQSLVAMRKKI